MKNVNELEKKELELSHAEGEQLALARRRDREIESGETVALSEGEFGWMTGGGIDFK